MIETNCTSIKQFYCDKLHRIRYDILQTVMTDEVCPGEVLFIVSNAARIFQSKWKIVQSVLK